MASEHADARFRSALAPLMEQFVQEKRACGYRYCEAARTLAGSRFHTAPDCNSGSSHDASVDIRATTVQES